MHHIDKGARHYLRVNEQWRNYNWQSICSEVGHLSDEGADVLVVNPAAKSRGKEKMTYLRGLIWQRHFKFQFGTHFKTLDFVVSMLREDIF